jgi:hypothetical protein
MKGLLQRIARQAAGPTPVRVRPRGGLRHEPLAITEEFPEAETLPAITAVSPTASESTDHHPADKRMIEEAERHEGPSESRPPLAAGDYRGRTQNLTRSESTAGTRAPASPPSRGAGDPEPSPDDEPRLDPRLNQTNPGQNGADIAKARSAAPAARAADPEPSSLSVPEALLEPAEPLSPTPFEHSREPVRNSEPIAIIEDRGAAREKDEVHVHIGHLEVTANIATSARQRAGRKRKQAMSLDEYLRRREREGS